MMKQYYMNVRYRRDSRVKKSRGNKGAKFIIVTPIYFLKIYKKEGSVVYVKLHDQTLYNHVYIVWNEKIIEYMWLLNFPDFTESCYNPMVIMLEIYSQSWRNHRDISSRNVNTVMGKVLFSLLSPSHPPTLRYCIFMWSLPRPNHAECFILC